MTQRTSVYPVTSALIAVGNLESSVRFFVEGFGLERTGSTVATEAAIGGFWGVKGDFEVVRLARSGSELGFVDLVGIPAASPPIRRRPTDLGIFTLNFRTNDLDAAIAKLESAGGRAVSEPMAYDVGKPMREVMIDAPGGFRLTLIQIGETVPDAAVFAEPVATYGIVVPSMERALGFYKDALGLEPALRFAHSGPPFDRLLGVDGDLSMDFATLTARGEWMAKIELLELEVTGVVAENKSEYCDLAHSGYTFLAFETDDLAATRGACANAGAEIIVEPDIFDRPFHEGSAAMIVQAPSGEYLEIIERAAADRR